MFVNANDIEKGGNQAVYVPKLDVAAFRLTQSNPIENAARRGEIDPQQPQTADEDAITFVTHAIQSRQGLCGITNHLAAQLQLACIAPLQRHGRRSHRSEVRTAQGTDCSAAFKTATRIHPRREQYAWRSV